MIRSYIPKPEAKMIDNKIPAVTKEEIENKISNILLIRFPMFSHELLKIMNEKIFNLMSCVDRGFLRN